MSDKEIAKELLIAMINKTLISHGDWSSDDNPADKVGEAFQTLCKHVSGELALKNG